MLLQDSSWASPLSEWVIHEAGCQCACFSCYRTAHERAHYLSELFTKQVVSVLVFPVTGQLMSEPIIWVSYSRSRLSVCLFFLLQDSSWASPLSEWVIHEAGCQCACFSCYRTAHERAHYLSELFTKQVVSVLVFPVTGQLMSEPIIWVSYSRSRLSVCLFFLLQDSSWASPLSEWVIHEAGCQCACFSCYRTAHERAHYLSELFTKQVVSVLVFPVTGQLMSEPIIWVSYSRSRLSVCLFFLLQDSSWASPLSEWVIHEAGCQCACFSCYRTAHERAHYLSELFTKQVVSVLVFPVTGQLMSEPIIWVSYSRSRLSVCLFLLLQDSSWASPLSEWVIHEAGCQCACFSCYRTAHERAHYLSELFTKQVVSVLVFPVTGQLMSEPIIWVSYSRSRLSVCLFFLLQDSSWASPLSEWVIHEAGCQCACFSCYRTAHERAHYLSELFTKQVVSVLVFPVTGQLMSEPIIWVSYSRSRLSVCLFFLLQDSSWASPLSEWVIHEAGCQCACFSCYRTAHERAHYLSELFTKQVVSVLVSPVTGQLMSEPIIWVSYSRSRLSVCLFLLLQDSSWASPLSEWVIHEAGCQCACFSCYRTAHERAHYLSELFTKQVVSVLVFPVTGQLMSEPIIWVSYSRSRLSVCLFFLLQDSSWASPLSEWVIHEAGCQCACFSCYRTAHERAHYLSELFTKQVVSVLVFPVTGQLMSEPIIWVSYSRSRLSVCLFFLLQDSSWASPLSEWVIHEAGCQCACFSCYRTAHERAHYLSELFTKQVVSVLVFPVTGQLMSEPIIWVSRDRMLWSGRGSVWSTWQPVWMPATLRLRSTQTHSSMRSSSEFRMN